MRTTEEGDIFPGESPPESNFSEYAEVAQPAEHVHGKHEVTGSNPVLSSKNGLYKLNMAV